MTRNKLYSLVLFLAVAGYFWLLINFHYGTDSLTTFCLFKRITGIPCPACGTTRSINCIVHGNWNGALYANPLGFLMFIVIIVFPVWIIADWIWKRNSFFVFYGKTETYFKKWWVAIPAIFAVILIWIENIRKNI
jgi:hypothetical protein